MKMTKEDYNALKEDMLAIINEIGLSSFEEDSKNTCKVYPDFNYDNVLAWNIYHMVDYEIHGRKLYNYLNDNHIQTAIKRIVKEYKGE